MFFATPAMRTVARMELPSTSALTTWTRLAWGSRFILIIIHEDFGFVNRHGILVYAIIPAW